uniref:DNA 5'-3' helicase n=1 Tax=Polysiphonia sertularioides TaxID=945028 RepID=A0A1Z1MGV9_9FLOR|nr:Replication helicase subunit [Polysiphonia sertularioides]
MNKFDQYISVPQNYIAEEILIGILLIYPNIAKDIKLLVWIEIFFIESNKIIYSKLISNSYTNFIDLFYDLESRKVLKEIGGINKITSVMKKSQIFVSSNKLNNYLIEVIKIIKRHYSRRLIIQLGYNVIKLGNKIELDEKYIHKKILLYFNNIEGKIVKNELKDTISIKELVSNKLLNIKYQKAYFNQNELKDIIKSGFPNIDKIIKKLPKGNLIIIAGRPSIGKTTFAINIAHNCFFNDRINLLIFSLEMSSSEIFHKFMSISSKIQINNELTKDNLRNKWHKISKICHKFIQNNMYVNEENNIDIEQLQSIAYNLKKKDDQIQLIVIDYLQLIEVNSQKHLTSNRSQEIGYITRKLKLLSQKLEIPIITISQLNRNIESRSDKEPMLSDLKESGCVGTTDSINVIVSTNQRLGTQVKSLTKYNKRIYLKSTHNNKSVNKEKFFVLAKTKSISISNKYLFKLVKKIRSLKLTFSHKNLNKNTWVTVNQISQYIKTNTFPMKTSLERKYIQKIKFTSYLKSYDVSKYNYPNIICKMNLIHNSIEQDADIIIILYEMQHLKYDQETIAKKIIDLKISKNRNGQTGYCKLLFEPHANTFKDLD